MRKHCGAVLLLFLVAVLGATPAIAKLSKDAKKWMNGPVRYLMDKEERKVFKKLPDDVAVEEFKKEFWAKRDPIPETETNEFKVRFEERVAFADKNFRSYSSDRGMVYILLGPPQERSDNPLGASIAQGGSETWTYASIRGQRTRTNYTLFFYDHNNNADHELWIGQDLDPQNPAFTPEGIDPCDIVFTDPKIVGLEPVPGDFQPAAEAASPAADAGPTTAPVPAGPPTAAAGAAAYVDRLIAGEAPLTDLDVAHSAYCFKDDKGTTLVMVNIGVFAAEKTEDPGFVAFARLVDAAGESYSFENEASFSAWKQNDKIKDNYLVYQAKGSMPGGTYTIYGGAYHKGDGTAGTFSESYEVPDYQSNALALSSIVVADELKGDPTGSGTNSPSAKPFRVGSTTILPNVDHVYTKNQELAVFFQTYEGQKNPETDQYIFQFQYKFYYEKDGRFRPYGKPKLVESDSPGQGYFVPLQTLRAGKYKLVVGVTDHIASATAKTTTFFTLVE